MGFPGRAFSLERLDGTAGQSNRELALAAQRNEKALSRACGGHIEEPRFLGLVLAGSRHLASPAQGDDGELEPLADRHGQLLDRVRKGVECAGALANLVRQLSVSQYRGASLRTVSYPETEACLGMLRAPVKGFYIFDQSALKKTKGRSRVFFPPRGADDARRRPGGAHEKQNWLISGFTLEPGLG